MAVAYNEENAKIEQDERKKAIENDEKKKQEYFDRIEPYYRLGRIINEPYHAENPTHNCLERLIARINLTYMSLKLKDQELKKSCHLMLYGPPVHYDTDLYSYQFILSKTFV